MKKEEWRGRGVKEKKRKKRRKKRYVVEYMLCFSLPPTTCTVHLKLNAHLYRPVRRSNFLHLTGVKIVSITFPNEEGFSSRDQNYRGGASFNIKIFSNRIIFWIFYPIEAEKQTRFRIYPFIHFRSNSHSSFFYIFSSVSKLLRVFDSNFYYQQKLPDTVIIPLSPRSV